MRDAPQALCHTDQLVPPGGIAWRSHPVLHLPLSDDARCGKRDGAAAHAADSVRACGGNLLTGAGVG
jgi:hypothetical protein